MKTEAQKKSDRKVLLLFGGAAVLFVLYYLVFIVPRGMVYRGRLQSLLPTQVQRVRLYTEELARGKPVVKERVLQPGDTAKFLTLVSGATTYFPSHPRGGWTCFVEVDTSTDMPRFSFSVHSTSNNGVYFDLFSNPSGRDGWNYGTLRNDALGPFVESLFRDGSRSEVRVP